MGRGMRFLESPATPEEDSYEYRVEWDDKLSSLKEMFENGFQCEHHAPGSMDVSGYDNAWELFNDFRDNPDYIGVRLIRIGSNGNEEVRASG